ncbi:TetR/AcrR family transcriptional regulator [Kribbella capetownensis]|uniref:TetR/AcrR family transcriptional regulator n=1 Tax=Kribbella capetownensis TaxID=1572659 RepID=A0A4V2M6N9_9ACTN|nr:TetR/AcrR family transcriptional regulator [Kribbella capetownensis]TCC44422.1 TetR/AcrR family transcriptional regulator [Kribbella capetownensis]
MTRRDPSSHAAAGISVSAIADAALAVIRGNGVDALTMRSVAERLNVRAPSLYHHVHNKDELLDLVARNAFDQFTGDNTAYQGLRSVDEWIAVTKAGALELRAFYADHPGLAGLIQAKATPDRDRGEGSRAELVRTQIESLVDLGVPEAQARHLFEVSARWTLAAVVAESNGSPDLFGDGLELFMDGLRARLQGLAT